MKKIILAAMLMLTAFNAPVETVCAHNALQITLANGIGSTNTVLSNVKNTISPSLNPPLYSHYFQYVLPPGIIVGGGNYDFIAPVVGYDRMSLFNRHTSWAGEISLGARLALGGSMFATLSAGMGTHMGFAQATVPVNSVVASVATNMQNATSPGSIDRVIFKTASTMAQKNVTTKGGMGYSFMLGLGKETSFGSASVDIGIVFRSFRFYFPSALGKQSQPAINPNNADQVIVNPIVGFTVMPGEHIALHEKDTNNYGSFYNSYTQTGFRLVGSLSFKIVDNLSFGISAAAELYGHKSVTINPNISSFSANPPAITTDASSASSHSATKASTIRHTNMMSTALTAMVKHFVTSTMITLTYSIPFGK